MNILGIVKGKSNGEKQKKKSKPAPTCEKAK